MTEAERVKIYNKIKDLDEKQTSLIRKYGPEALGSKNYKNLRREILKLRSIISPKQAIRQSNKRLSKMQYSLENQPITDENFKKLEKKYGDEVLWAARFARSLGTSGEGMTMNKYFEHRKAMRAGEDYKDWKFKQEKAQNDAYFAAKEREDKTIWGRIKRKKDDLMYYLFPPRTGEGFPEIVSEHYKKWEEDKKRKEEHKKKYPPITGGIWKEE